MTPVYVPPPTHNPGIVATTPSPYFSGGGGGGYHHVVKGGGYQKPHHHKQGAPCDDEDDEDCGHGSGDGPLPPGIKPVSCGEKNIMEKASMKLIYTKRRNIFLFLNILLDFGRVDKLEY